MAKRKEPEKIEANLSYQQMETAIQKIDRRIADLESFDVDSVTDASETDEQKGFMMMFAGAVAGLRNPRAHKIIKDDPEMALEFIAFVSLLAKLVDKSSK
ncbi:TPA: hypothetical protein DEW47_02650 [Patescibacteria group bacterium]|nr:MAG: hypothetical protein UT71_C0004G0041 [Parcubacteria group bacterium GW2011_GWF2_40_10]KKR47223.1 MAG: hypothetical protein UT83_C0012G0024 [Parcubacteria group bacterium GW2011_GWA2_40_143]KKR60187.1 MAG: hypothetical protein UT97_C0004G0056 [Parcubacteria group bacterium GW2011_GWC2_40_31]KKR75064.1 MAG: hypothetical protein UU18_C0014G0009 [Parcubacteria group bacterium GW2011_GWB2_40_8]KKR77267.1 MAG: hypothetical protein UU20_C0011G0008 [Parcubacteria group bacterium GW2011_GWE2_40_